MPSFAPRRIVIESEVWDGSLARRLRSLSGVDVVRVDRAGESPEASSGEAFDTIEVVDFRGRFLKSCPGTRHYHCCGYRILHFGVQCTLGCTYCILQAYLNTPNLRLFGNTDTLLDEVKNELLANPHHLYRIGTGEFTDSLLLDPWTAFSRTLVPLFAEQPNAVLELKTKTDHIDHLQDLPHGGHTIVAWSLNAPSVRAREEPFTADLRRRLRAAQRVTDWGYHLAFHFDPMIHTRNWQAGYGRIVDQLFDHVDPRRVVWISLGAFRFMPELKGIIQTRHPRSRILTGEFIRGLDGKMRYFRDIRVELYAFMAERLRRIDPDLCVYLCMEGGDIWREGLGFSPEERGGLPAMLDRAVRDRMGIEAPSF